MTCGFLASPAPRGRACREAHDTPRPETSPDPEGKSRCLPGPMYFNEYRSSSARPDKTAVTQANTHLRYRRGEPQYLSPAPLVKTDWLIAPRNDQVSGPCSLPQRDPLLPPVVEPENFGMYSLGTYSRRAEPLNRVLALTASSP